MRYEIVSFVVLGIAFLLVVPPSDAKPRRADSKGVTYAVEVTTPGSGEPEYLVLDPGRDAWLSSSTNWQGATPIRFGAGLAWVFLRDTRLTSLEGYGYFEVEALDGRTFDAAAEAYQAKLKDLWAQNNITFHRVLNVKEISRLKVAGCTTKAVRILQDVTVRVSGRRVSPQTMLFEMNGNLVSLTYRGRNDYFTPMLKGLKKVKAGMWKKPGSTHVIDVLGNPMQAAFFALRLPAGFRHRMTPAKIQGIGEKGVVACWYRPAGSADQPGREMTLRRLTLDPTLSPEAAVAAYVEPWQAGGGAVSEQHAVKIDGLDGVELAFTRPAEGEGSDGTVAWLAAWKTTYAVHALILEARRPDPCSTADLRREGLEILEKLQTWEAAPYS